MCLVIRRMMGIMKAKKKEIKVLTLADLGISAADMQAKMNDPKFSLPSPRKGGIKITGEAARCCKRISKAFARRSKGYIERRN